MTALNCSFSAEFRAYKKHEASQHSRGIESVDLILIRLAKDINVIYMHVCLWIGIDVGTGGVGGGLGS